MESIPGPPELRSAGHEKYSGLKQWGWYLDDLDRWRELFGTAERVKALEIGAFDGVSANMMLDMLFVHPGSEVHAVDPYLLDPTTSEVGPETREVFCENVRRGDHLGRVHLYEGVSAEVLAWMAAEDGFWEAFDFIYIDGSHLAKDVFIDAALSWNLLKLGGIIGFDDFEWGQWTHPLARPWIAIDAFERVFADRLELILDGWRRFFRKIA